MKRNYEKMIAEYDRKERDASGGYTFDDFMDLLHYAEDSPGAVSLNCSYEIKTHPVALIYVAFRIGYMAALRHLKAQERRERTQSKKAAQMARSGTAAAMNTHR